MCGIAGLFHRSGAPVARAVLEQMTRVLAHRGPDGEGLHLDGSIGLGHRRLAVLDLTLAGAQPMASHDGELWLTYNGEIFNFQDIRSELEGRGYRFRSRTDTEVILCAFHAWGIDCLAKLNGMFAFALWDARQQTLWLARDRLGVKPLFYAERSDVVAFASEIKGILPALPDTPRLNQEALHHFLSLNYTPAPLTFFDGIVQVPPAHYLRCPRNGPLQVKRYWDLQPHASQQNGTATQQLERLLSDAVRLRLVSDVEVGAFLSGGVDSGAVVAWMQRHAERPVKTFTAAFQEPSYNEASYARRVARSLGTTHYEQPVAHDDLALLPKLVWHSEELTADSSMLALYRVAECARRHVKVVLTGDGADELFGGYPTYLATRLAGYYRRLPEMVRQGVIRPMVDRLPVCDGKVSVESRLRRFVNGDLETAARAHASWRIIFTEREKQALVTTHNTWPPTTSLYELFVEHAPQQDLINRLLYADLCFYLPNDMLVKVDRMTMAWGLEARTPYLDYRVVEFAASLPSHVKSGWGFKGKRLLRQAARGLLPDTIRLRSKAGFNIPKAQWLRRDQGAFVERHLLDERPSVFALLERREIERIVREHLRGVADHGHQLWSLLCLSSWSQQFLDGQVVYEVPVPAMTSTRVMPVR